ncbi:alpha/beta hydrolase [Bacillus sp. FJAT-22090]|uniref:alpha/beta hydrolase n=1 Tax=Bacillus sp. FJAT-22090 TaxID=1581038 RepID=UPI0011A4BCB3|nr:alpha/beta hydrolase [Bacillus sp. FJAT-22090]
MKNEKVIKTTLGFIGFPLTLVNIYTNKKNKVNGLGNLVKINDRVIHTIDSGSDDSKYTVILDAGLSCCSIDWYYIQPKVSEFSKVISFDRAGYGWSSSVKGKYTSENVVEDLIKVLEKLNTKPPYVLVGHSFGGLNMRLFASKYPKLVAALILIDSVHEKRYLSSEWDEERKNIHKKNLKLFRLGYITSSLGIPRLLKQPVGRKRLPEPYQKYINYIGYNPKTFEAVYKEFFYSEESASQLRDSKPLNKELPITVLSSNNNDASWVKHQNILSNLTNNTIQIKTDDGHSIHLENPEIVIDTIKEVINKLDKNKS